MAGVLRGDQESHPAHEEPGGEGCGLEKTEILRNVLSGWTHNVALTGKASGQLKGMAAAKTIFVDWIAHLVNSNYQYSFFKNWSLFFFLYNLEKPGQEVDNLGENPQ